MSEPTPNAPIELEPLESNTRADPGQHTPLGGPPRAQPEARLDIAPAPAPKPVQKGPLRTPWQSLVSRLLLAWLPTYGAYRVCGVSAGEAAVSSTALTLVFAPTCEWVTQRARAMPLAYGVGSIIFAATTIGYALGGALVFTLPWLNDGQGALALASVAAAAATTAWYALGVERFGATRRVVIVGGGTAVGALIADAHEEEERFEIVAIVADDPSPTVAVNPLLKGSTSDLGAVIRDYAPDLVVIGVEKGRPEIFRRLLDAASAEFSMLGVPEFYEVAFGRLPIRELTPAWFMSTLHVYTRPYNRFTKRVFDIAVALVGIVLSLPLVPVVAVIVKSTRGPLLYRQTRLGEHGKHFRITKFRTMRADAESANGAVWAVNDDPRIIPGGRFLRKTRIDELPQLWNVLKGEMSIVGPRPERPEFIVALETEVPFWQQRGLLRPGITGWAQIRAGYAADELGAERKLSYDLWYLRHRSLTLDAAICVRTIGTLVTGSGAR